MDDDAHLVNAWNTLAVLYTLDIGCRIITTPVDPNDLGMRGFSYDNYMKAVLKMLAHKVFLRTKIF